MTFHAFNPSNPPIVEISDLRVAFDATPVLRGIDLTIARGEAVGMVGESGCGKSVTWLAALGLLPKRASISGSVRLDGEELLHAPRRHLEQVRGGRIAMVFQDPVSALNPVHKVGDQVIEALRLHRGLKGAAARFEALHLFDQVGIPDSARRLGAYPHELSGGQNQRVMIAMALAGQPDVLIADEPTTALDVTIQAQILDLLQQVRRDTGMALVLISHDLGVIGEVCDRALVLYAGQVVEEAPVDLLFSRPSHPYTSGLLAALPRIDGPRKTLATIPGIVPHPSELAFGCAFAPRCHQRALICSTTEVRLPVGGQQLRHRSACLLHGSTPARPEVALA
ncbi:ABC transporter ATP-binding protein [Phyllobacterium chamaecytisi]|uniref:ABC transporter ATP-binding protein n=1 Tax=Phyllobacterium chamaecytisi TaxID=2876082 RepID=UPI001CD03527|nr:ABC transporter ATP-binding protein [Phyllobacterium sp. KW56]MBZ9603005.1 ABC transporter ATP-binding protein [Phyllobacterium sp. KW56]